MLFNGFPFCEIHIAKSTLAGIKLLANPARANFANFKEQNQLKMEGWSTYVPSQLSYSTEVYYQTLKQNTKN